MTDKLTKEKRSWNMSQIHSKNTKPELITRSILHKLGYRFRLHKKDLPGKPDIVLKKYRIVIFVHGCFWHRHDNCKEASRPKSNSQYWEDKIQKNIDRDIKYEKELTNLGWRVIIIWECELKGSLDEMAEFIKRKLL